MVYGVCKLWRLAPRLPRRRPGCCIALALILAAISPACNMSQRHTVLTVHDLESARPTIPFDNRRSVASETVKECEFYRPLGPRLGLLLIKNRLQWEKLCAAAPELGPCPDLSRGMVVGVASHAGLPLNGDWPIRLEAVRVRSGAGFALAHFEGGSFLSDGVTFVETAQVEGLTTVLMADVDGARFYPQ